MSHDDPFDHTAETEIDPDAHPAENVDRMIENMAESMLEKAQERAADGKPEKAARSLILAAEINDRHSQPADLPISVPDHDIGDEAARSVDNFFTIICRDFLLSHERFEDDSEIAEHIDKMRQEMAARLKRGDV